MTYASRSLHTKYLFAKLIRSRSCDLILDVGSRDAQEALIFRKTVPKADVLAIEANPDNFRRIIENQEVTSAAIETLQAAAWNANGSLTFHVTPVDDTDPRANRGTSSIMPHLLVEQVPIEVKAVRLDELVRVRFPNARRIALWIDVEGAEAEVIEGLSGVSELVEVVHLETSTTVMHEGQRLHDDLCAMLGAMGLPIVGSHFDGGAWGDALFARRGAEGARLHVACARALHAVPRRRIARALYDHTPALHAFLRRRFRHSAVLTGY